MRKLKLQVQITVDGFIAGVNGEMDWMTFNWDDKLNEYVTKLTDSIDCILLGRTLAQGFIPYWEKVASDPSDPQYPFGKIMHDTPRVVFSKTLNDIEWHNTTLAKGELSLEINKLKNQNGKDIIVYGGGTFVSALIKEGLIDEFHLFVNPVALGNGMSIFKNLDNKQNLHLIKAIAFPCGVVVLNYEQPH
ncbi:MAG: dihydrofolate reductase [Bacteroidetes bacterium]|nr:dihydrofolate reductase [Bacteroidota bacterium]